MAEAADNALFPEVATPKRRAFLVGYACTGTLPEAAAAAKCCWRNHYNWLRDDPDYAAAWPLAVRIAGDMLESEAVRRAKVRSDVLMIFLLKGAKPEKYRENVHVQQEVSGEVTLTWSDRLSRAHTSLEERRLGHPHVA